MRVVFPGLCFSADDQGIAFSHNPWLVLLSCVTAVFASFVALNMAERMTGSVGRSRLAWQMGAASALGGGIWAMHFIGMLALRVAVPIAWEPGLTLASLITAVAFVAAGLEAVRHGRGSVTRFALAGTVVGLGIAAMHYTGMAAMEAPGRIAYRPGLFALSVLIAMAAATVALMLSVSLKQGWHRALAALVMGIAICGMHYTGMAATVLTLDPLTPAPTDVDREPLAIIVAGATYGLLMLALVAALADRRLNAAAEREAQRLKSINRALEVEVDERRRAEEELLRVREGLEEAVAERTRDLAAARSRAEAANQAKSEFLASMSHELRTPLNAVLGFAQLMDYNKAREPLTPKQERGIQQIVKNGNHLLHLIDEVLDLARIEAGQLPLSLEPVDPRLVVEDALTSLQPVAERARVTVATILPEVTPSVLADRTRLIQVVTNLLSNAVKYNRPGGAVRVTLGASSVPGRLALSVQDTGQGIATEKLGDLFQPFNRLGQEYSDIPGTGIGLAITRRLLSAMDGTIEVTSVLGEGSTFTVSLPVALTPVPEARTPGAESKPPLHAKPRTMLYVEDNPSNIQLMRDLMETLPGTKLLVAADPVTGLDLAVGHQPNVIILDINLPGMNGFDVLARLKDREETRDIPVLALSANALPREIEKGLRAGFRRYLTKPLNVQEFMEALADAMEPAHAV
ncbi:hybrid sensor histidine kinase/response regulator [Nitrospirillum iridis]|uniref:histidine kinase n=1 Tax=Nitrospirillum iridis TaxID=765888 RepID=A0A7X0AX59_9PROT|nr:MHYT domain-containing protein [Nitrospirillum iridis]MBB6250735.1 signal transduction histidine kinase/ActR/RegA family two-component response regulator [Nitrospirillum iridis]